MFLKTIFARPRAHFRRSRDRWRIVFNSFPWNFNFDGPRRLIHNFERDTIPRVPRHSGRGESIVGRRRSVREHRHISVKRWRALSLSPPSPPPSATSSDTRAWDIIKCLRSITSSPHPFVPYTSLRLYNIMRVRPRCRAISVCGEHTIPGRLPYVYPNIAPSLR